MTVPQPRTPRCQPCWRHHMHMVNCPDCCAWHRDHLRDQREKAQRGADREAGT